MNNIKPRDMDVFEILGKLDTISDKSNKAEWLKDNFTGHQPLQYVLKMNYCGTIRSKLPEGEPPFNKTETDGPTPASLWSYLKTFPLLVQSVQSNKMPMIRIEQLFIEMLEAIEPKEAETVCLAKDRKLEERFGITSEIVRVAFPGLIAQPATMPEIVPPSNEERAESLLDAAKQIKTQIKTLQNEAREMEKEAKELLKEAKTNDASATG